MLSDGDKQRPPPSEQAVFDRSTGVKGVLHHPPGGLSVEWWGGMSRQQRSPPGPPTKAYPQRYVEEAERSEGCRWQAGHGESFCRQTQGSTSLRAAPRESRIQLIDAAP